MTQPTKTHPPSKTQRLVAELSTLHPEAAAHLRAVCAITTSTTSRLLQARANFDGLAKAVTEMMENTNPQTIAATMAALDVRDTRRKRRGSHNPAQQPTKTTP